MAYRCDGCDKKRLYSRKVAHKPGVAGGQWKKRAPSTHKISLPNLHAYKGQRLCTKCLRRAKKLAPVVRTSQKTSQE
ncbi:hypothetical protein COT65_00720 [Candidatus Shapirobacteria bacterium CG09_land_8_20_14_0_10_47_13]|uniref:50S ribosomal protein L28 n=1 Tax=Candidatus Shapirobacteria bacterium CG09_land_8_20_14_0_10_47_13 TaxID=1974481 RepID=A0A2H0WN69_9BACT|nr:MAG: hypothetical protein COT65_00720 [Candidatus Shapirobacteria bacterium CG09_land_8_20_14_0_10_47_13]